MMPRDKAIVDISLRSERSKFMQRILNRASDIAFMFFF